MKKKNLGCIVWALAILLFLPLAIIGGIIYAMVYGYKNGKFNNITSKINRLIGKLYKKVFKKELSKPILSPKGFTILTTILIFLVMLSFGEKETEVKIDTNVSSNKVVSKQDSSNKTNTNETITTESENYSNQNASDENKEVSNNTTTQSNSDDTKDIFDGYKLIEVDGGDLSGHREPNVVVDIGFGDRQYWAFTNEYGQLVKVIAKKIILQDDSTEPVNSKGRYYRDEAKVPGVESKNLDEGHVIADSLGGVSNAYNITPQNSTLNRHGDQAYMEKVIRDAGGCTDFVAKITYPNTETTIPSHYSYTYTINGNVINDEFDNINPDKHNSILKSNPSNDKLNSASSEGSDTKDNSNTDKYNDDVNNNTTNKSQSSSNNSSKNNNYNDDSNNNVTNESQNSSDNVYWTPNGKSYHSTKGCPTLSRSKTILSGTQAESGKLDPCDKCH